jgi:hypothetical protein
LLLDSDLKGSIELPVSYFVDDQSVSSTEKLDLLMMINGWRCYLWDDVEAHKTVSIDDWNDAGFEVKGYVKKLLWNVPLADAKVVMETVRKNYVIDSTTTNGYGRFSYERFFLMDSVKVMLNARTKKGSKNAEIILDPAKKMNFDFSVSSLNNTCFNVGPDENVNSYDLFRQKNLEFNPGNGSILLSGVDVVKNKKPKGDGHFRLYSTPDNALTVTKSDYTFSNVLEFLEGKVGGLSISGEDVSIRGGGTPLFLVDGIEPIDGVKDIIHIPMSEIEKVEVLKSAGNLVVFGSKGTNGVIAIYRKSGSDMEHTDVYYKGRTMLNIKGFHKPQKFYSPTYTLENIKSHDPDFRPTLFWNPELKFENEKTSIDFFTSDEQSEYQVIVEGISKNGKICFGTTNFTVNKNQVGYHK